MTSCGQSVRPQMIWLAAVGAALAFAAAACSSAEEPATAPEVPPVPTTAAMEEQPREDPDAEEPETTHTTEPPPVTEAPAPTTTTTTTTEPPDPGPQITWWYTPRLYETQLSASWQVSPADEDADPEEVNCRFELLNADGEVIGEGTADLHETNPAGRGMKAEYDPGTAEDLGDVKITCRLKGAGDSVSEYKVQRVNYQGRHPDSVFPADDEHYFDHDEVAALFSQCRSYGRPDLRTNGALPYYVDFEVVDQNGDDWITTNDWHDMRLDYWSEAYANWDADKRENATGHEFATGYWTDEQLRLVFPNSGLVAKDAPKALSFDERSGVLTVNPGWTNRDFSADISWGVFPEKFAYVEADDDGYAYTYVMKDLYLRLEDTVGYVNGWVTPDQYESSAPHLGAVAAIITDDGLPGTRPNPVRMRPENLLWDWMDARYNFPPSDREPSAWAMRTLLEARDSYCVVREMRVHCESGDFHISPHMRHPSQGGSRLGSVLWSTVCPEITP